MWVRRPRGFGGAIRPLKERSLETSMTTPPAIVAADEEGIATSKYTVVPGEMEAVVVDCPGHPVDGEVVVAEHGHATARLALTVSGLDDDAHADDLPVLHVP
jgi:hypothetical protein